MASGSIGVVTDNRVDSPAGGSAAAGRRRWGALRAAAAMLLPAVALGLFVALWGMNVFVFKAGPADAWTYLAAGERLNDGHALYRLAPGDRPVEIKPPHWTVPLLSPPPMAVLWRPLALLPADVAVTLWWLAAMAILGTVVLAALRARPVFGAVAILVFLLPLVFQSASGNVNGLLIGGTVATWLLIRSNHDRSAGIVVATMTLVKVVPAVLLVWLLASRRYRAAGWAIGAGVVLLALSIVGAGIESHLEYLGIMSYTARTGQSQFSLAGIAQSFGVPGGVAAILPLGTLLLGLTVAWVTGRRGDASTAFTAAAFTMVWGSPVVNFDWLALMFAGLAPAFWPLRSTVSSARGRSDAPTGVLATSR